MTSKLGTVTPSDAASGNEGAIGPTGPSAPAWTRHGPHALVAVVLLFSFVLRLALSGHRSYWLDELYSVYLYVVLHESVFSAIFDLARTSIHPPLYQTGLYFWVAIFGDSEIATRSLSNLYITIATLFVYLLTRRLFGSTTGVAAAIAFTLTPAATRYGMETRSYAQTIMIVAASSYALVVWLEAMRERDGVGRALLSWPAGGLAVANSALLLTHYFNLFFWAAQALFVGGYLLLTEHDRRRRNLVDAAVNYAFQLSVFVVIWGPVFYITVIQRPAAQYATPMPEHSPLDGIVAATELTYRFGPLDSRIVLAVALVVLVGSVATATRRSPDISRNRHVLGSAYVTVMAALPAVVMYLAFTLRGAERFSPRYFLFLVPVLAIALIVAGRETLIALITSTSRRTGRPSADHLRRVGLGYALAFIIALVVPGTVDASTAPTAGDWRGTAKEIVTIIESNPDRRYAIYETSFRQSPVLDYYLGRFSEEIRVDGLIRRHDERRGEFTFEQRPEDLEGFDFLIVPFIHHRTTDFPIAVDRLQSMFEIHHARIDNEGQGIIIYTLSGNGAGS